MPTTPPTPDGPAVSKLAAKVAHELNNPLDAVLRFVSLAQRKAKSGDYTDIDRHLADAQFGLQRMAEVLRELMDIGRETNDVLTRTTQAPLADIIAAATRTAAAHAEQKQVTLAVCNFLPDTLAPTFDLRLTQVLANLLKNAVEATPDSTTVRLTVTAHAPTDPATPRTLHLLVEDCGQGVPPHLRPQLFTPFVTSKPKGAGHGLGLAISRELVLSLGGTLTVENRRTPLTGCAATITLPLP